MKYSRQLFCLALLSLAMVGCSDPEPDAAIEPVALVSIEAAVTGDLPVMVQGYGSVEFDPSGVHTLNAEIEARVLELSSRAGDVVEKDQVLVRLVPTTAGGTEVAQARRDAAAAQATAERTKRLRGDGLASDADVEAADTTARDLLEQANSLEARSGAILTLRAPGSGVIDSLFAEAGDLIAPGTAIVRLASPDVLQGRIGIEVEDAVQLHTGDPVTLHTLDNAAAEVDTVIHLVDTRVDPATRMAAALVTIPPGQGFLPGEAVRADILAGTRAAVLIVPRAAVFNDETGSYVFVARGDTAELRRVETGLTSGESTEIRAGVTAGDAIIVAGAATLSDGMKIRTAAAGSIP